MRCERPPFSCGHDAHLSSLAAWYLSQPAMDSGTLPDSWVDWGVSNRRASRFELQSSNHSAIGFFQFLMPSHFKNRRWKDSIRLQYVCFSVCVSAYLFFTKVSSTLPILIACWLFTHLFLNVGTLSSFNMMDFQYMKTSLKVVPTAFVWSLSGAEFSLGNFLT